MESSQEEFQAKLQEIFRVEAAEHLEAITAGLVAMERAGEAERAPLVERVFREAHSLKGAARSVSLSAVEGLCLELESIFAAMKREELTLSTALLDTLHPALDALSALCAGVGSAPDAATRQQEWLALSALRQVIPGAKGQVKPQTVAPQAQPARVPPPPPRPDPPRWSPRPEGDRTGPGPAADTAAREPGDSRRARPESGPAAANGGGRRDRQAEPGPAAGGTAAGGTVAPETIRVSTQKLTSLLVEAEELVGVKIAATGHAVELQRLATDLGRFNQRRQRESAGRGSVHAAPAVDSDLLYTKALEKALRDLSRAVHQSTRSLSLVSDEMLEDTKKLLLLPCSYLLNLFPKMVRDLARGQGKEAELIILGEDIEVGRQVLDELKDPLIHLVRNCIDHGLERPADRVAHGKREHGSLTIAVAPVHGNQVELTVSDDGVGIDENRVREAAVRLGLVTRAEANRMAKAEAMGLIFHSGLSTSPIITDLSGRGLGLAIVREKVEKLGGTMAVTSIPGVGTTFRLLLPLSLATFRGVLVHIAGQRFAIPTASVARVARVRPHEVRTVENQETICIGDRVVSLARLKNVLGLPGPDKRSADAIRPVVLVQAADRTVAFLVDEVLGEQEMMVKGLGPQLPRVRNVAGASIAASGVVIPVLNALDLVESATMAGAPARAAETADGSPERRGRLLIAEDSITTRTLVKTILEGAGYDVVATVDGIDALTTLKTETFDLVVSDVDMPRMNGFELTAKIRADDKLKELPVILVTALGSQKDREYGVQVGANAYIVKSDFDQSNLLEIIRRLI